MNIMIIVIIVHCTIHYVTALRISEFDSKDGGRRNNKKKTILRCGYNLIEMISRMHGVALIVDIWYI